MFRFSLDLFLISNLNHVIHEMKDCGLKVKGNLRDLKTLTDMNLTLLKGAKSFKQNTWSSDKYKTMKNEKG